jgi:threonine dehydratase
LKIDLRDIEDAATRLSGVATLTPLVTSPELDEIAGGRVFVKAESLQLTGSFKIRGAYNVMRQLAKDQAERGVVAWSSGNHAQGVAAAGSLLGIRTAIVMPEDAPRIKIENTRRLGGEPILYDRFSGDREAIARQVAAQRDAELVPSYDHAGIITGQGTVGLEIMRQCADAGVKPEQVLVPCSGGGLVAGIALAVKGLKPIINVHPVEPEGLDDTARSLRAGQRVKNDPAARSMCDSLQAPTPGGMTFDINLGLLAEGLAVSDADVEAAIRFAFLKLKLVAEPGGAVALAAVLARKIETKDRVTVVVLSGGNVDPELFCRIVAPAAN